MESARRNSMNEIVEHNVMTTEVLNTQGMLAIDLKTP
jgi:hypothetical protein